jgi:septal ring factor EnvC (AmiA/AmiB activator)
MATAPAPSPTPFPTAASRGEGARVPPQSKTKKKANNHKIKKQMEALWKHMDAMEDAHNTTKAQLEEANKALKKTTEELTKSRNIATNLYNLLREHSIVD